MTLSKIAICNRALDLIGADTLTSLDDPSHAARLCKRAYPPCRNAVLRSYPWNAAMRRAALPAMLNRPIWGYRRQYALPPTCLRLWSIEGAPAQWRDYRVEGRRVLTNLEPPLHILFIGRMDDPAEMDPLLAEAIAARIAADLAMPLAGSATLAREMAERAAERVIEARRADAAEGTPGALVAQDWIEARG